jgi:hypothetical protein
MAAPSTRPSVQMVVADTAVPGFRHLPRIRGTPRRTGLSLVPLDPVGLLLSILSSGAKTVSTEVVSGAEPRQRLGTACRR